MPIDLFVGIIFIVEAGYNLFILPGGLKDKIVDYDRIIEIVNIFEIFWNVAGGTRNIVLVFMRSVKATRIKKLRK